MLILMNPVVYHPFNYKLEGELFLPYFYKYKKI